jgi:DNA polymerase sigma
VPWSDLNVVVTFRSRNISDKDVLKQVERFHVFLHRQADFVSQSDVGERKNISILKLRTTLAFANKRVEVIFRRSMVQGLPKNESIISGYLDTYPGARELYYLVRRIFHVAALDDPADGGINTLALFLLVIAFVQKIESATSHADAPFPKAPESARSIDVTTCGDFQSHASGFEAQRPAPSLHHYLNPQKLGETFLNLLYFYGHMFDFGANFIRTYVSRFSKCHPFSVKPDTSLNSLMILNPFDHNLVITKSFKKTALLKQTFKLLYNHYFSSCSCSSSPLVTSPVPLFRTPQVLLTRVECHENADAACSRQALRFSLAESSILPPAPGNSTHPASEADQPEFRRGSKGRSRLSSKSVVFVTPVAGDKRPPEPVLAPSFPLQAIFAYNFQ